MLTLETSLAPLRALAWVNLGLSSAPRPPLAAATAPPAEMARAATPITIGGDGRTRKIEPRGTATRFALVGFAARRFPPFDPPDPLGACLSSSEAIGVDWPEGRRLWPRRSARWLPMDESLRCSGSDGEARL